MAIGDAILTNAFLVDLGKFRVATYQEVTGLKFGLETSEVTSVTAAGETLIRQQPSKQLGQEITLSRPVDEQAKQWVDWVMQCAEVGDWDSTRQNIAITALNRNKKPTLRFNLTNAWASSWQGSALEGGNSSPAVETVTIIYEDLNVESP
ncbi:phage tail protein [Streptomyces chattanoogensis]|uniref:phage tail protein n=1 Tax=Streptomyces chattanoogensis TaxID=66876 RepID=UPI0036BC18A3